MFLKRSNEKELIDLGLSHYSSTEYNACLKQLGRIGKVLGGDRITFKTLQRLTPFCSLLDVGCGGGDFAYRAASLFPACQIVGMDIEEKAVDYANQTFKKDNLSFRWHKGNLKEYKESFDLVTSTFVCHHLDDSSLVEFIQQLYRIAKKAVILNDLHRHPLAYASFAFISPLLFRNRLIQHDGLLSIKKGFKEKEWIDLFHLAKIPKEKISIQRKWPFRWCITLEK